MAYSEPIYDFPDFKQHVRKRGGMWRGSSQLQKVPVWVMRGGTYQRDNVDTSEATLKCIDEIIVNAIDHYFTSINATPQFGGPVTQIHVSMQNGEITVSNDGPGFPVYKLGDHYLPELIMTREYSSSRISDERDPDRVTGGLNGVGMKVCIASSKYFVLETYDHARKLRYKQEIHDGMREVRPPEVQPGQPCNTTIRFLLDYDNLCPGGSTDIVKWVQFRVEQAAAFINAIDYRTSGSERIAYRNKASVFFNGRRIMHTFEEFCTAFPANGMARYCFMHAGPNVRFPMKFCVAVSETDDTPELTMVNGVCLGSGGSHVAMMHRKLYDAMADKIAKELTGINEASCRRTLRKSLYIISACQIPLPNFEGQVKSKIILTDAKVKALSKEISIPAELVSTLWPALSSRIVNAVYKKKAPQRRRKQYKNLRKYQPARYAGRRSAQCLLFVPEGDSAELPVTTLIRAGVVLDPDYCGTYNIQGVPMNSIKGSKYVGDGLLVQNEQLKNNKAFQGLVQALGLDYSHHYYCGPDFQKRQEGDAQFAKLNYGALVIATDQDLDGIGQICSLILVFFLRFFPNLVQRGFVQRMNTPIKRVIIGRTKRNFYSEKEYQAWLTEQGGSLPRGAEVRYYKGLGEHSQEEIIKDIATNILHNLITFTYDEFAIDMMQKMYGKSSIDRKQILTTPCLEYYEEHAYARQQVSCAQHFSIESKRFQLDFLTRKLKNAVDGLVESQRKAFAGARRYFRRKRGITKVYQLTGHVAKTMHYVHGDQCMNDTIIRMAQSFTGANNIPVFLPISQGFGTRVKGRSKHSSPRYLDIGYNDAMDLVFPLADDPLLQYVIDDGEMCEPKFYVPIVPYAILETATTTSAGWNISVWARDFKVVLNRLRRMIAEDRTDTGQTQAPYPGILIGHPWLKKDMSVSITMKGGRPTEMCFGSHYYDASRNTLYITQLPLRLWSFDVYCIALGYDAKKEDANSPYVKDCVDNTSEDKVRMEIKFKPGGYESICNSHGDELLDPMQDFFGLYKDMQPRLNLTIEGGFVREFESYENVMQYWYVYRRDLYILRLRRERIVAELLVMYYENITRFLRESMENRIDISRKPQAEREQILSQAGFQRFRANLLKNPGMEPTETLRARILDGDYGYIDRLTVGHTEKSRLKKLDDKLQAARDHLDALRKRTWKELWTSELKLLEAKVAEGERTGWQFGNCGFTYT